MTKYYWTSRFRFLHSISGRIFSALIAILPFVFRNVSLFNLIFFALLGFTIASIIYRLVKENITISDQGINYEGPDATFATQWDGIERISSGWHFSSRTERIIVDKSLIQVIKYPPRRIQRFPFWGVSQTVFIRLSYFADNWRDSELGQQIKQYAPHLFQ